MQVGKLPATAAQVPDPEDLARGALAVLVKVPAAAFALTDLLASVCNGDGDHARGAVVGYLVDTLRGGGIATSDMHSNLLAPAHLLALLMAQDAATRSMATQKGA